ncbi:MAG: hypothetical protein AMS24_01415 [Chlamydiae bacterium SM23_39]|nr:MAG: hypothetical protein AMS24_01415 [Chlamydiae bacterium SM23_39]
MKKSLITGLIILLPIIITFFVISFILNLFTDPFFEITYNLLQKLEKPFPILASKQILTLISRIIIILLFLLVILLLGFLGKWFFFKSLLNLTNKIFMKIPFFKTIYHTSKDMISSLLSIKERKAFRYPVMIKFPSKKSNCIGITSGSVPYEIQKNFNEELEPIFVPTAPQPISGYLILAKKKDITKIDMTNEEAVKFTVSCGVITPEIIKELKDGEKTS